MRLGRCIAPRSERKAARTSSSSPTRSFAKRKPCSTRSARPTRSARSGEIFRSSSSTSSGRCRSGIGEAVEAGSAGVHRREEKRTAEDAEEERGYGRKTSRHDRRDRDALGGADVLAADGGGAGRGGR